MRRAVTTVVGAVLTCLALLLASALPAWAAQAITLTWVRHAQSTANAEGVIDTTVPGPGLTALGQTQAQAIAQTLQGNGYDGIFVSDMVRTQLTAAPLAAGLGITPVVLPGLQEVNAGIFEGGSGLLAGIGYTLPPAAWVFGARFVPVLGGENGNQFEARVNDAVAQIYATGDTNPIAFSHGATITAWTLMNVDNPNLLLAITHPLGNTAVVVVNGNPQDGWTLQSWDGVAVDARPGPITRLFVAARAIVVAPQTAVYDFFHGPRTQRPSPARSAPRVAAAVARQADAERPTAALHPVSRPAAVRQAGAGVARAVTGDHAREGAGTRTAGPGHAAARATA